MRWLDCLGQRYCPIQLRGKIRSGKKRKETPTQKKNELNILRYEETTLAKKKGRPKGARTEDNPVVIVDVPKCPKCGSINRDNYSHTKTMDFNGIHNGQVYTKVIWRQTKCADCFQKRIDKFFE